MKRHKLIQRLTAALVAGAMALSFCAPALAEAPSAAADPAAPAATASTAENSTADTIVFDQLYLGTQEDWAKTIADGSSGDVPCSTPPQTAPSPSPAPTSGRSPSPRPA